MMQSLETKIKKATGSHYTPTELASFVSQQIISNYPKDSGKTIRILDPAVGDGELLLAISSQLIRNGMTNFELHGFDTDIEAINFAKKRLKKVLPNQKIDLNAEDFLQFVLKNYSHFGLFQDYNLGLYDLIITNPPYVRTQVMGATIKRLG